MDYAYMHGLFLDDAWNCMDYGWNVHGLCMDYAWTMHGPCMDYGWTVHGLRTAYAWIIAWIVCGLCMHYA